MTIEEEIRDLKAQGWDIMAGLEQAQKHLAILNQKIQQKSAQLQKEQQNVRNNEDKPE